MPPKHTEIRRTVKQKRIESVDVGFWGWLLTICIHRWSGMLFSGHSGGILLRLSRSEGVVGGIDLVMLGRDSGERCRGRETNEGSANAPVGNMTQPESRTEKYTIYKM